MPVAAQSVRFFDVSEENAEITQKGGQKCHFTPFQTPGSPRLASGSPGPPK